MKHFSVFGHLPSRLTRRSATRDLSRPLEHARRVVPKIYSLHQRLKGSLPTFIFLNPLRAFYESKAFSEPKAMLLESGDGF
jgi:hypothetical protein